MGSRAYSVSRLAVPLQLVSSPLLAHDRRVGSQRPRRPHELRMLLLPQLHDHDLVRSADKQPRDRVSAHSIGRYISFDLW